MDYDIAAYRIQSREDESRTMIKCCPDKEVRLNAKFPAPIILLMNGDFRGHVGKIIKSSSTVQIFCCCCCVRWRVAAHPAVYDRFDIIILWVDAAATSQKNLRTFKFQ